MQDLNKILLPVETALDDIPGLACTEEETRTLRHGNPLTFLHKSDLARLDQAQIDWKGREDDVTALALDPQNKPIGLIAVNGAKIKPQRLFNL